MSSAEFAHSMVSVKGLSCLIKNKLLGKKEECVKME